MRNYVNRVLVTNSVAADVAESTLPTITAGAIWVLDEDQISAADANTENFYVVQGLGNGKAIMSSIINKASVTKVVKSAYSAPTEQVQTLGFNGTDKTLPSISNNKEYVLRVIYKDDQRVVANRQTRNEYFYTSDSSATSGEVYGNLVAQVNNDLNAYVSATLLTNGTFTAFANDITVVKGSKTITANAADVANISAGDLIRIGGTGNTVPVYLVASASGTTITLKSVYEGASATVLAANVGEMSAITSYGIQLTGEDFTVNDKVDLYQKLGFDSTVGPSVGTLSDFTTGVTTTELFYGKGYWKEVRDMEYFAQGYTGTSNRTKFPDNLSNPSTHAQEGVNYNVYTITHEHVGATEFQGLRSHPVNTTIAFAKNGGADSAEDTAFAAIFATMGITIS